MPELKRIYSLLKDTDVAMKTGQREPNLALEMLIGKISSNRESCSEKSADPRKECKTKDEVQENEERK